MEKGFVDLVFDEMWDKVKEGDFEGIKGYWSKVEYGAKLSDFNMAVRKLAMRLQLSYYDGKYFYFNGKVWRPVAIDAIKYAYCLLLDRLNLSNLASYYQTFNDNFLGTIKFRKELRPRMDVIAFENGVLDCRDFSFHAFDAEYSVTGYMPFKYNPKARCPMWNSFLKEVLPEKTSRVILQMFMGLGLMERSSVWDSGREGYNVELCLMLLGTGGNGKSTIYRTMAGIFGREKISGLDYGDLVKPTDEGLRARSTMRGKVFNWCVDSNETDFGKKHAEIFKKVVSGESLLDRRIGENVAENARMPYLIFNLNNLPTINKGLAMVRRLQYINFRVTIPKNKQNPHLAQDLMNEYSGIFNWIVRGCKELKRKRFVFPNSGGSKKLLIESVVTSDPVLAWIKAYDIRHSAEARNEICVEMRSGDLYDYLERWLNLNGLASSLPTKNGFGREMQKNGFNKIRRGDGIYYQVYGCDDEHLMRELTIEDIAEAEDDYDEEVHGTFISEED